MREVLIAGEGEVWTNGEIYGFEIYLADCVNKEDFYTIPVEEYKEILKKEEEANNVLFE